MPSSRMDKPPLISIVTPSFNQGKYIEETLQSLVDQNYPNLEVIIQDGGSQDRSIDIAKKFCRSHPGVFRLCQEKDTGQSDALNLGFAKASGEILGHLNSDDVLLPGCLKQVAKEIDPRKRRYIVFGRSVFIGKDTPFHGQEHPARYRGHYEQLAIWKRGYNSIPQPSTFWHRDVWEKCGGFDENEEDAPDYDLFCRFSRKFWFHKVNQPWSSFRIHSDSKTANKTPEEILEVCIQISRRYWGSWLRPLRWRCSISYWQFRKETDERLLSHLRKTKGDLKSMGLFRLLVAFAKAFRFSPRLAQSRLLCPWLAVRDHPALAAWLWPRSIFAKRYSDNWIGPAYRERIQIPKNRHRLEIRLAHSPRPGHAAARANLKLNGKWQSQGESSSQGDLELTADVSAFQGREVLLEIVSNSYFMPYHEGDSDDERQLSFLMKEMTFADNRRNATLEPLEATR